MTAAARQRRVPLLVRLRNVLLVVVLLFVAGLLGLYFFGRAGLDTLTAPASVDGQDMLSDVDANVTTTSQGFDYTQYEEGRALFRLQGEYYREDRSSVVELEGVNLEIFRPDGSTFRVRGKEAIYNRAEQSAQLEGDVEVEGPRQLRLWTERMLVTDQGNRIVTPVPVRYSYAGKMRGRAQQLRVNLPTRTYLLQGVVRMRNLPSVDTPFGVNATRAFLEEDRRLLRAEGNVRVTRWSDWMDAKRISLFLAEDSNIARFLRARWEVRGVFHGPESPRYRQDLHAQDGAQEDEATPGDDPGLDDPGLDDAAEDSAAAQPAEASEPEPDTSGPPPGAVFYAAESLSAVFDTAGNVRKIELDGSPRTPATLLSRDVDTGNERTLTSNYLVGDFNTVTVRLVPEGTTGSQVGPSGTGSQPKTQRGTRLEVVQAYGQVRLVERERDAPPARFLRQIRAERGRAETGAGGKLTSATFAGDVDYREPPVSVKASRAELDGATGKARFTGTPVVLEGEQGQLTAPIVSYSRDQELVEAEGGVRAMLQQLPERSVPGPLMQGGEGPVWVESESAWWRQPDSTFVFRGRVRTWRGENLLLADEMRLREPSEELVATGNVKTVWYPPPPEGQQGGAGSVSEPIEVTADSVTYLGQERRLRYEGNVVVVDATRTMACGVADMSLDAEQRLKRLICSGGAEVRDSASGQRVEGDVAVYEVARRLVDVTGDPVTMRDRNGTQVQGRRAVYNIETGLLELRSLEEPTPEEPAPNEPAPEAETEEQSPLQVDSMENKP